MIYRRFGKTDINISLLSLGSGGHNPFGQRTGVPERKIHTLIHRALDLGINHFDTAARPSYDDSELILGRALQGVSRDRYTLSSKFGVFDAETGDITTPQRAVQYVEEGLQYLQVDELDVLLLGGGTVGDDYTRMMDDLRTTFERLVRDGKVRYIGSSESSSADGKHSWLTTAVEDELISVVMIAYNLMNQSAERTVLPACRVRDLGAMGIYTVRNAFSQPTRLAEVFAELKQDGLLGEEVLNEDPLGWLLDEEEPSLIATAYRFSANNKDVSTILTGTIEVPHLEANVEAIEKPPLAAAKLARLRELFGHLSVPIGN